MDTADLPLRQLQHELASVTDNVKNGLEDLGKEALRLKINSVAENFDTESASTISKSDHDTAADTTCRCRIVLFVGSSDDPLLEKSMECTLRTVTHREGSITRQFTNSPTFSFLAEEIYVESQKHGSQKYFGMANAYYFELTLEPYEQGQEVLGNHRSLWSYLVLFCEKTFVPSYYATNESLDLKLHVDTPFRNLMSDIPYVLEVEISWPIIQMS